MAIYYLALCVRFTKDTILVGIFWGEKMWLMAPRGGKMVHGIYTVSDTGIEKWLCV